MRHVLILIAMTGLVAAGCGDSRQSATSEDASSAAQMTTIPDDVGYSVIASDEVPGTKRSLDIRLNKKVSEDVLRAIALALKSQESREYDRTFMAYYLPGTAVGSGAWATTHFGPDLEVRILGLTIDDEERLLADSAAANREVIGNWLDERPYVGSRITIFREDGKLFIERVFKAGRTHKDELVEKTTRSGRRFDTTGSTRGGYRVIDSNGNLQLHDREGLIATIRKME